MASDMSTEGAQLRAVIEQYQYAYAQHQTAPNEAERAAWFEELGIIQESLWLLVEPLIRAVARGWAQSWALQDARLLGSPTDEYPSTLQSQTMSLWLLLIEELPRFIIDPTKNVQAAVKRILQFRLTDQQRRLVRDYRRSVTPNDMPEGTEAGTEWLDRLRRAPTTEDDAGEAQWINRMHESAVLAQVLDFWQANLCKADQLIMQRWIVDPPTPFRAIADQLGAGWPESMVRQRHHRILRRTRQFLEEQGLLDP